jgi:hypothetical protein
MMKLKIKKGGTEKMAADGDTGKKGVVLELYFHFNGRFQ